MSFLRPEARATLSRWSEVLISLSIAALGIWAMSRSGWLVRSAGTGIAVIGAALTFTAWRRMQFSGFKGGTGLVEVDERQISYFAPFQGGVVSIDMLARVSIATDSSGALSWIFEEDAGSQLVVPADAAGSELLFDALAALPGVDYDRAMQARHAGPGQSFTIWSRERAKLH